MRNIALMLVACLLMLSLSACKQDAHKAMLEEAALEVEAAWEERYGDESFERCEPYFEIKNTRVIELKKNKIEELEDVKYIVEFVVFVDYYGTAPYYVTAPRYDDVLVYKDGSMEVASRVLSTYSARTLDYDYEFIKDIIDYGGKYNCKKTLA